MTLRSLSFLFAALAFHATALAADAPPAPAQKISVVNIQKIMQESAAAKSVREQLDQKQKAYQGELSKKEDALQKEDQELSKQRSVLSKEAFEEKVKSFRAKATEVQKEAASKKQVLDNALEKALGEIQKTTADIINQMAKEKGFMIAIPTSQILYADGSLDITDPVLKQLNEKLPKIDVKFEAPKAAAKSEKKE